MNCKKVAVEIGKNLHSYQINIGHDLLKDCGNWAKNCLSKNTKRIVIISNPKIFKLYGEIAQNSFEKAGFQVFVWLMKDGEKYKNFRSFELALNFIGEHKLTRTDAIVALGGGVVGDLTGFSASVYLRGIAFLQIPTTLLSMIDSSVGGKTGINSVHGKNLLGAFHQPNGVLIDVKTLETLPVRELIAGFCEAVKQGAIANEQLFNKTAIFLEQYQTNKFKKYFQNPEFLEDLENLLSAQVSFKADIVRQDERENTDRIDIKSRKILNFGHTLAHALEKVTQYKYFKHGEAVGYGILFAAELSKRLDILDEDRLKLLNNVLASIGKLPKLDNIKLEEIVEAFKFDKKSIGNSLQWILLEDIGKPKIVANTHISQNIFRKTLEKILNQ